MKIFRIFINPKEALDRAVDILRSANSLIVKGAGRVGDRALVLVNVEDLESVLARLQQAGITAEPESSTDGQVRHPPESSKARSEETE